MHYFSGLQRRKPGMKKKRVKGNFHSDGPLYLISLDGHNKLKGFDNWAFPIGVYGCIDTFSRKIMFMDVLRSNSNPISIAFCYVKFLKETKILPENMRLDKGTETVDMTAVHSWLTKKLRPDIADPTTTVRFGASVDNKIERLWLDIRLKVVDKFKKELIYLQRNGFYDAESEEERDILAYSFIPVVQREVDRFVCFWNHHKIRRQNEKGDKILPDGAVNFIFDNPEVFGFRQHGTPIPDRLVDEVSSLIPLPQCLDIVLNHDVLQFCEQHHPTINDLNSPCEARDAFIELKNKWCSHVGLYV